MSIIMMSEYPQMSDQGDNNVAFTLWGESKALIVYEGHRDFLSAPRPFVVLQIHFALEPILTTGGHWLSQEQWEELRQNDYGIYRIKHSEFCQSPQENHWICHSKSLTLEFCALSLLNKETLYHKSSVYHALQHHLNNLDLG